MPARSRNDGGTGTARALPAFVWLALGVTLLRVMYLVLWCPYELAGDEAQYWDWSRRLELSYHTKGPGVAWAIAASTSVFGTSEWSVRLPAALSGGVLMLAAGLLARDMTREPHDRNRHALCAALLAALIPAYQASALLMTIDGPMLACWAIAAWAGWRALVPDSAGTPSDESRARSDENRARCDEHRAREVAQATSRSAESTGATASLSGRAPNAGEPRTGGTPVPPIHDPRLHWWLLLGLSLGVGFLFKYTTLLLAMGMFGYALFAAKRAANESERETHSRGASFAGPLLALAVFTLCALPVIIWNAQRGWPTVAHLLGHLGAPGGDVPASDGKGRAWSPMWAIEFILSQLALVGPALALMVMAFKTRGVLARGAISFCAWCGLPTLGFYALVSLFTDAEGNWPIAGYFTLLVPAAVLGHAEARRIRARNLTWRAQPREQRKREGLLRARPESAAQIAWHWAIAYGIGAAVVMVSMFPLSRLPGIGGVVPVHRLSGASVRAVRVWSMMEDARARTASRRVLVIADGYQSAALLAFYLPGRPAVFCAMNVLGGRRTPYDDFADTNFHNPDLLGLPAVLVGGGEKKWSRVLRFDSIELVHSPEGTAPGSTDPDGTVARGPHPKLALPPVCIGLRYGGVREHESKEDSAADARTSP